MNLSDASKQAELVRAQIAQHCLPGFCNIAGSIRRKKVDLIKDIEIVAIPHNAKLRELMQLVNDNPHWGSPIAGKFPSKYTKIRGCYNLDLFWCTKETYGLNFFIRTGPQSFVTRALSIWKKITGGGYSQEAQLRLADGTIVPTPTEEAVFEALKWNFVRPEHRV
jgi:DNA polymerase/3'-5' exonuclease PolX